MKQRVVLCRLAMGGVVVLMLLIAGTTSASAHSGMHAKLSSGSNNEPNSSGSATKVKRRDGGGALLTSVDYGYGQIQVKMPTGVTLDALTALSTQFEVTAGACTGNAPRFEVVVRPPARHSAEENLTVYFGTQPNGGCSSQQSQTEDATQSDWWLGGGDSTYDQIRPPKLARGRCLTSTLLWTEVGHRRPILNRSSSRT